MFSRILPAAGLALALLAAPAFAEDGASVAGEACANVNEYGPVEIVASVEDGFGDWFVWTKDKDGDLWLCNANASGAVFTNVVMEGDLLAGDGPAVLGLQPVADHGTSSDGAQTAEGLCAAVGSYIEEMSVVVTVEDGLGDYLVWMKNADQGLWLCNASGKAELFDFEPIDMPINGVVTEEPRSA